MKKIILLFTILGLSIMKAQVTTEVIDLTSNYTAKIDVNATDVIVTFIGPENLWLGLGFGVLAMTVDGDVITFDSTGFNDRRFIGEGMLPPTDTQDWTILTNTVEAGMRTLVVTRPVMGSDSTDFIFDETDIGFNLVWAHGDNTNVLSNHEQGNRGALFAILVPLSIDDENLTNLISIFPVPASDLVTVSISEFHSDHALMEIYSVIGELIYKQTISNKNTIVDISALSAGIYLLNVYSGDGIGTAKIVKN